ncbi:MAG: AglZ/HisF2 family acetamidino modification protein [Thermanaerothrix sp.]|nr:AglZ/HisF2 family acetamidino modification protein [Thermanaerothrix sp.]
MLRHRIIPCLLLSGGGLVKTTRFSSPRYVGDPINVIRIFNEKEVDELILLDIEASRQNRPPDFELIEQIAGECFMPLCYGGGIKTFEQASRLFSLGVEKVSLQSAALESPELIRKIADHYGSQAVVISADVKKSWLGKKKLYFSSRDKALDLPLEEFLWRCVNLGAGEVLLNSVDRDGTMEGVDCDLIREIAGKLPVPLIAMGGAGSLLHMRSAIEAGASAVAAGGFFFFMDLIGQFL